MPRLPPSLLHRAHRISPHLKTLLPVCRDLESAQNELRWIREHVVTSHPSPASSYSSPSSLSHEQNKVVAHLVARRGTYAEPLQYVLGSQPFGSLDIKCARGVLIPRPETEAYVYHLAGVLRQRKGELRILDLCTGTGCISLLLYERLVRKFPDLQVTGLDISPTAVGLARENLERNVKGGVLRGGARSAVTFEKADIFTEEWRRHIDGRVDVLVSNPPYISTEGFNCSTGRSVRNFEPRLALVPDEGLRLAAAALHCDLADVFYARLFEIAETLKPRFMLFEVGDLKQAMRVVKMAARLSKPNGFGYEIWRDEPDVDNCETCKLDSEGSQLKIRGEGHGRSVMIYRKSNDGADST